MCEANVYMAQSDDGDDLNLILEAVDRVIPEEDGNWRLISIFGEQKLIKGRIKYMKLVDHQVVFEPL